MVKMVDFMLCIFYHNLKFKERTEREGGTDRQSWRKRERERERDMG